jgi:hypothetical protein
MSVDITMQISACTIKKDVYCSAHSCGEITIESSSDRNRWGIWKSKYRKQAKIRLFKVGIH